MQPAVSLFCRALNSLNVKELIELIKEQTANRKLYSLLSLILGEKRKRKKKKNRDEITMYKTRKDLFF